MNGSSLVVLERTLELLVDAMPPEQDPAIAEGVSAIRQYLQSPDAPNAASIQSIVMKLAGLAHDHRQFLIAARLEAFAREMHGTVGTTM